MRQWKIDLASQYIEEMLESEIPNLQFKLGDESGPVYRMVRSGLLYEFVITHDEAMMAIQKYRMKNPSYRIQNAVDYLKRVKALEDINLEHNINRHGFYRVATVAYLMNNFNLNNVQACKAISEFAGE